MSTLYLVGAFLISNSCRSALCTVSKRREQI